MHRTILAALAGSFCVASTLAWAEPDRQLLGLGVYAGVDFGPSVLWLPAIEGPEVFVQGSDASNTLDAPRALTGFGGELTLGLPLAGSALLGGGLRLEARGGGGSLETESSETFSANPGLETGGALPDFAGSAFQVFANFPEDLMIAYTREATTWSAEGRVYLDYTLGGTVLSPFAGIYGGRLDQLTSIEYFVSPGDPTIMQKFNLEQGFLGGQLGLAALLPLSERWALGLEGRLALLGQTTDYKDRLFSRGDDQPRAAEDDDSRLALRADLEARASYRFAGGIVFSAGLQGSYLSDVATVDLGAYDPDSDTATANRLAFEGAWIASAMVELRVPF